MIARRRGLLYRHPPAHGIEPTRALAGLGAVAAVVLLTGCAGPAPAPSPSPTTAVASPAPTSGPGGYENLSQACTAIADDLITLQTIAGTVEVGLGAEGADAIIDELEEMRELAPVTLRATYRSVEEAILALPQPDAAASPTATPGSLPTATSAPSPTPAPTMTPTPIRGVIEAATDDLTAWLTRHCSDL